MASEEKNDPKDLERRKFLEEIRRRAEEAEMRRIEEEELSAPIVDPEEDITPVVQETAPVPKRESPALPPVDEELLIDLRSRFTLAIDRKNSEEASELYDELADLIPGTIELRSFQRALRSLTRASHRAPEIPPSPPPDEEQDKKVREQRKKKIAALLEQSLSLYQQEKYDKARVTVEELLALEKDNEDATELLSKISKAKELADLV